MFLIMAYKKTSPYLVGEKVLEGISYWYSFEKVRQYSKFWDQKGVNKVFQIQKDFKRISEGFQKGFRRISEGFQMDKKN